MELLAVVMLMGILAAVATARYGRSIFAEFGARGEARKLSLALLAAQRSSITTGDNHFVEFDGIQASRYRIMRRVGGSPAEVQGWEPTSGDVTITVSGTVMEFNFEGQALGAYTADCVGKNRSVRLTVIPISGAVQVTETS